MSSEIPEESRSESSPSGRSVGTLLDQPLLLGVVFGFVLLFVGAIRSEGAVAGMLGIYGVTIILVSAGIYAVLAVTRRNQ